MFQKRKNKHYPSDSKARNFTLSEYIYIILSYAIFIERFRLKQKKKYTCSLKNMSFLKSIPSSRFPGVVYPYPPKSFSSVVNSYPPKSFSPVVNSYPPKSFSPVVNSYPPKLLFCIYNKWHQLLLNIS